MKAKKSFKNYLFPDRYKTRRAYKRDYLLYKKSSERVVNFNTWRLPVDCHETYPAI